MEMPGHQAILYEEIDRLIAAALLKGAPDIQIVMGNQRIPIRLLETVQQRSFRLILLARVIGVHHKGLFVTDADATGRPEAGAMVEMRQMVSPAACPCSGSA